MQSGSGQPVQMRPAGLPVPMKHDLPPYLQMLFSARGRLPFVPSASKPQYRPYDSILDPQMKLMDRLEKSKPGEPVILVSKEAAKKEAWFDKLEEHKTKLKEAYAQCRFAQKIIRVCESEIFSIIVGRLDYKTTEEKLKEVCGRYGTVKNVRIVKDKDGKSRGYGFVEFKNKSEFKSAYKQADGITIDGKRVMIDAELARMKPGWRPRRLGGGRGDTRRSKNHPYREKKVDAEKGTKADDDKAPGVRTGDDRRERSRERSAERRRDFRDRDDRRDRDRDRSRDRERDRDRRDQYPARSRGFDNFDRDRRDRDRDRREKPKDDGDNDRRDKGRGFRLEEGEITRKPKADRDSGSRSVKKDKKEKHHRRDD